jgi:glycosyltransferase involved in cell wall biosynthesis
LQKKQALLLQKSLDIVHPLYNPPLAWEQDLVRYYREFAGYLPKQTIVSVYLVNDGSSRGIEAEQLAYIRREIPRFTFIDLPKNLGKGGALREAVAKTTGDMVIYTDADYPYVIQNALDMFGRLDREEADVVVGVRDEQYYDQLPLPRKIFSLSLKVMNYLFFPRLKVKDTQSGLKGFNQKGKDLFLKTKIPAFLFDMEFLVLASYANDIRIAWIYVQVREGVQFSSMRFKTILTELANFGLILLRRGK